MELQPAGVVADSQAEDTAVREGGHTAEGPVAHESAEFREVQLGDYSRRR